ncbi:MAG: chromate transporter [Rhodothermales bacterium]
MSEHTSVAASGRATSLAELMGLFSKLGLIAFGGPAAHIAMLEEEVVVRRKWLTHQHFLDLVGATNLIPGPNSTEMMMHIGYERAGWRGLVAAGGAFILPAAACTGLAAWFYVRYGDLPAVEPYLTGIRPAVLIIILSALWRLGRRPSRGGPWVCWPSWLP